LQKEYREKLQLGSQTIMQSAQRNLNKRNRNKVQGEYTKICRGVHKNMQVGYTKMQVKKGLRYKVKIAKGVQRKLQLGA